MLETLGAGKVELVSREVALDYLKDLKGLLENRTVTAELKAKARAMREAGCSYFQIAHALGLSKRLESTTRSMPRYLMHPMRSREALQLHLAAFPELELPAALHQCLQQRRHQNLPS